MLFSKIRTNRSYCTNNFLITPLKSAFKSLFIETHLEEPLCKKKAPKVIFEGFGAYSIDISVTYFVQTKDFAKFQATKQAINLGILKVLEKEEIVMARS